MKSDYDYYNLVEKELLDIAMSEPERKMADELELAQIVHIIKQLAMELSRNSPSDWNKFMDVVIVL